MTKILSWFKSFLKEAHSDGPFESYHDNGQLKCKGTYKDGQRDGYCEFYYENGELESKGNFKDGT